MDMSLSSSELLGRSAGITFDDISLFSLSCTGLRGVRLAAMLRLQQHDIMLIYMAELKSRKEARPRVTKLQPESVSIGRIFMSDCLLTTLFRS